MWPWSNQWEHALLGKKSSYMTTFVVQIYFSRWAQNCFLRAGFQVVLWLNSSELLGRWTAQSCYVAEQFRVVMSLNSSELLCRWTVQSCSVVKQFRVILSLNSSELFCGWTVQSSYIGEQFRVVLWLNSSGLSRWTVQSCFVTGFRTVIVFRLRETGTGKPCKW